MQLLDGKATAEQIRVELRNAVNERKQKGQKIPHLAAVLVGSDGGSLTYVNAKVKACDEVGFGSTLIRYEESISENELLNKIRELNSEPDVDGILVQLPLPDHIRSENVISAIDFHYA